MCLYDIVWQISKFATYKLYLEVIYDLGTKARIPILKKWLKILTFNKTKINLMRVYTTIFPSGLVDC